MVNSMSKTLSKTPAISLSELSCEIDVAATLRWIRSREQIAINGNPLDALLHIDFGCAEIDGSPPSIEGGYMHLLEAESSGKETIAALLTGDEAQAQRLGLRVEAAVA